MFFFGPEAHLEILAFGGRDFSGRRPGEWKGAYVGSKPQNFAGIVMWKPEKIVTVSFTKFIYKYIIYIYLRKSWEIPKK